MGEKMLWRSPRISTIAVVIFTLMDLHVRLVVSQDIEEFTVPAVDGCPSGWTLLSGTPGTAADNPFCVKFHPEQLPYAQAQQVCKDMGTFLINHDSPTVTAFMDTAADSRLKKELFGGLGAEREYWTGLHYDGKALVWDGKLPSSPSLNIYCRNRVEFGSLWRGGWFCEDLNSWNVSVQSPCGAARLSQYSSAPDEVPRLQLQDCQERKPFVCGGHFNADTYALRAESTRCESGWFWNSYSKLCLKVLPTRVSFAEAQSRCQSHGSTSRLFEGFDKEKRILLMNFLQLSHSLLSDQQVWTNFRCKSIRYESGAKLTRQTVSCDTLLPFVCQAEEKNITDIPTASAEITVDGSLLCKVNIPESSSPVSYAYLAPNRTIVKSTRVSEGLPLSMADLGTYRCIAYVEEAARYVYSDKAYHKAYPTQYHLTMNLPIDSGSVRFAPWNSMVRYYPQLGKDTRTVYTVLSYKKTLKKIINPAFVQTRREIVDTGCVDCGSLDVRITSLINIRNNVVPGRVSVTINMYYFSTSLGVDGYFDLLNTQLKRNLITRLSLSREEATELVIVTPTGQEVTIMPRSPTPITSRPSSMVTTSLVNRDNTTLGVIETTTSVPVTQSSTSTDFNITSKYISLSLVNATDDTTLLVSSRATPLPSVSISEFTAPSDGGLITLPTDSFTPNSTSSAAISSNMTKSEPTVAATVTTTPVTDKMLNLTTLSSGNLTGRTTTASIIIDTSYDNATQSATTPPSNFNSSLTDMFLFENVSMTTGVTTSASVNRTRGVTSSAIVNMTTGVTTSASVNKTAGVSTSARVNKTRGVTSSAIVSMTKGVTTSASVNRTRGVTSSAIVNMTTGVTTSASVNKTAGVSTSASVTMTTGVTTSASVNKTAGVPTSASVDMTNVTSSPKYNVTAGDITFHSDHTTAGYNTTFKSNTTVHVTTPPTVDRVTNSATTAAPKVAEMVKVCQPTKWHPNGVNKTVPVPSGVEGQVVNLYRCVNPDKRLQVKCRNTRWEEISSCPIKKDISPNTLALLELSQKTENVTDSSTAVTVLEEISQKSNNSLKSDEVSIITGILTDLVNVPIENKTVLNKYYTLVFESVNNMLDADEEVFESTSEGVESSTRIIQLVEDLMHKPLPESLLNQSADIFVVSKPQLAFKLSTDKNLRGVVSLEENITSESIVYVNSSSLMADHEPLAELRLGDTSVFNATLRKAFVVYGSDKLHRSARRYFSPVNKIMSATLAMADGTPLVIRNTADIVSITYNQKKLDNHTENSLKCGYWNSTTRQWSTKGCDTSISNSSEVVCSCNHLTDFSVLLDRSPQSKPKVHKEVLTYISFVGLIISSVALCCVVFTTLLFKRLRKTNSQKVLSLLSLSLLSLNITFMIGRKMTQNHGSCVAVAVFLHYFLLTAFAWMFVEAILQYLRFVRVIGTYVPRFMVKTSIPALAIPALVVAVTIAVSSGTGTDLYKGSDEYCWMKPTAMYYSVLLPIGLVLVANVTIFGVVVANLVAARRRMSGHKLHTRNTSSTLHLKAAIAVFIILGLTWIFGFLALIQQSSLVFQYLFCIFNSLQGLFIFCSHNVREPKVQAAWLKLFRCNKAKQVSFNGNVKGHHNHAADKKCEKVKMMTSSFSDSNDSSGSTADSTLLPQKST